MPRVSVKPPRTKVTTHRRIAKTVAKEVAATARKRAPPDPQYDWVGSGLLILSTAALAYGVYVIYRKHTAEAPPKPDNPRVVDIEQPEPLPEGAYPTEMATAEEEEPISDVPEVFAPTDLREAPITTEEPAIKVEPQEEEEEDGGVGDDPELPVAEPEPEPEPEPERKTVSFQTPQASSKKPQAKTPVVPQTSTYKTRTNASVTSSSQLRVFQPMSVY